MRRDRVGPLIVLLVVAVLGAFVWATRNPEAPLLSRAREWPLVGPAVDKFRSQYGVGAEGPQRLEGEDPTVGPIGESQFPAVEKFQRQPRVWVNTDVRLREAPQNDAETVARVARIASLPVVEQRGEWYRVLYQGKLAWVALPGYDDELPPMGRDPDPPQPLPGRSADEDLLRFSIELLGEEATTSDLGPYGLVTDHDDPELLEILEKIVARIEPFYADRYGVSPIDRPRETVVLFSSEAAYRRFQSRLDRVAGLPATGIASRGLVAVFVGGRGRAEVAATFVHELAHLLSRRALGPALPPWLDEGIADDLGYSRISDAGALHPEVLSGSWRDVGPTRIWFGGQAAARALERALAAGGTVPVAELLTMEWEDFVDPTRSLHYPQSAFFVRFLVDDDPILSAGFRGYLEGVASGESVHADALLRRLGRSAEDLEAGFLRWLPGELAALTSVGDS